MVAALIYSLSDTQLWRLLWQEQQRSPTCRFRLSSSNIVSIAENSVVRKCISCWCFFNNTKLFNLLFTLLSMRVVNQVTITSRNSIYAIWSCTVLNEIKLTCNRPLWLIEIGGFYGSIVANFRLNRARLCENKSPWKIRLRLMKRSVETPATELQRTFPYRVSLSIARPWREFLTSIRINLADWSHVHTAKKRFDAQTFSTDSNGFQRRWHFSRLQCQ